LGGEQVLDLRKELISERRSIFKIRWEYAEKINARLATRYANGAWTGPGRTSNKKHWTEPATGADMRIYGSEFRRQCTSATCLDIVRGTPGFFNQQECNECDEEKVYEYIEKKYEKKCRSGCVWQVMNQHRSQNCTEVYFDG